MSSALASSNQAKNWFKPGVGGNPTGRPKGTPNKLGASIKEMVEKALTKAGGVDYLARQAELNPVAFMGLVGRVLPLQLANADGQALVVDFRWADGNASATVEHTTTQPEAIEVEWKESE